MYVRKICSIRVLQIVHYQIHYWDSSLNHTTISRAKAIVYKTDIMCGSVLELKYTACSYWLLHQVDLSHVSFFWLWISSFFIVPLILNLVVWYSFSLSDFFRLKVVGILLVKRFLITFWNKESLISVFLIYIKFVISVIGVNYFDFIKIVIRLTYCRYVPWVKGLERINNKENCFKSFFYFNNQICLLLLQ